MGPSKEKRLEKIRAGVAGSSETIGRAAMVSAADGGGSPRWRRNWGPRRGRADGSYLCLRARVHPQDDFRRLETRTCTENPDDDWVLQSDGRVVVDGTDAAAWAGDAGGDRRGRLRAPAR